LIPKNTVNSMPLRSLPYLQSNRLFAVWSRSTLHGSELMHVSPADFYDWRTQSHAFESLTAYGSWPMNLTNIEEPRRLDTQLVSANLFSTLGVHAQIGGHSRRMKIRHRAPSSLSLATTTARVTQLVCILVSQNAGQWTSAIPRTGFPTAINWLPWSARKWLQATDTKSTTRPLTDAQEVE